MRKNPGVPVVKITQEDSSIKFAVKASVPIEGAFDKRDTTMTFSSTDAEAGFLEIKIQADSVNTGSGMKDGKLKSKDFFNAKQDPYITFKSAKFLQTGPDTLEMQGIFTIRGVSRPETLPSLCLAKEQAVVKSKGQWRSTQGLRDEQWYSIYQNR